MQWEFKKQTLNSIDFNWNCRNKCIKWSGAGHYKSGLASCSNINGHLVSPKTEFEWKRYTILNDIGFGKNLLINKFYGNNFSGFVKGPLRGQASRPQFKLKVDFRLKLKVHLSYLHLGPNHLIRHPSKVPFLVPL